LQLAELQKGYTIKTEKGKKVTIETILGEGGQGTVYKVNYSGQDKALKWYTGKRINNPKEFCDNLKKNIEKGKPSNLFLWPEDLTINEGSAFGYIMDLRPDEYVEFPKFLIGKVGFASITAMNNAAMQITAGLKQLHGRGYTYQDLNDGNFFINPKNGNVLICDNDNVFPYGKDSGISGKARYMAPEIVAKGGKPDIWTDRYSLAVILFLLWTNNHPLEGKAACPVYMDTEHEKKIYGTKPVFIYDPEDKSNRPVQGIHRGAIERWPFLPEYLKEQFFNVFSKELLLNDPKKRIMDQEWLKIFIRMRAEIYKCPFCSEVYFADPVTPNECPKCKTKNVFPFYIKIYKYNLPVHQRAKIYACHTKNDPDMFEILEGEVTQTGDEFQLKNVSTDKWTVTKGKKTNHVMLNDTITLKKGMEINFGQSKAEII
jgi:serine/threonine protein kinase